MKILHLVVGPLETNCYIPYNEETKKCVIVDPGDEPGRIIDALHKNGLTPEAILLTHAHYDHIMAVNEIKEAYPGIRIIISEAEQRMVENEDLNSPFGPAGGYRIKPTEYVRDGERITAAGLSFDVILTPGHTAGSVCYEMKNYNLMFSGDTIFRHSEGRTDLGTGSEGDMEKSLEKVLISSRPDDEMILPGHGGITSVGEERNIRGFGR